MFINGWAGVLQLTVSSTIDHKLVRKYVKICYYHLVQLHYMYKITDWLLISSSLSKTNPMVLLACILHFIQK